MKILVVEDETLIAMNLCGELRNHGYEVLKPVASGEEAVQIAFKENPDLIIFDIYLKGKLNGIEAAQEVKCNQKYMDFIFVSGYTNNEYVNETSELHPLAFLDKPYNIKVILNLIRE